MNIALINFSGNVGKTTLGYHLLKQRLPQATLIGIETINDAGNYYDVQVRAKNFAAVQDELLTSDNIILDVGSSNVEQTLMEMKKYKGSHEDIELFLIPVTSESKQQKDSVNTIRFLLDLGIPASKIRVIFNLVQPDEDVQMVFSAIYHAVNDLSINPQIPVIYENEFYDDPYVKSGQYTLSSLISNKAVLKDSLKQAPAEDKDKIKHLIALSRLALTVDENLQQAFAQLFTTALTLAD